MRRYDDPIGRERERPREAASEPPRAVTRQAGLGGVGELARLAAPGAGAARETYVGALQQTAGNQAVGAVLARGPGGGTATRSRRGRSSAPALPPLYLDDDGFLSKDDPGGGPRLHVGRVAGDKAYLCHGKGAEPAAPFVDAELGSVEPGGSILSAREVKVEPTGEAEDTTSAGGDAARPVKVTAKGGQLGVLFDWGAGEFHEPILKKNGSWNPIPFEKLSEGLRATLQEVPEAHLKLEDGGFWSLMSFHLRDERTDKARWVRAKDDVKDKRKGLDTDAAALPANLKEQVDGYLNIIASVMTHEGTYTSRSPGSDPMASVGIFQWGMEKNKPSGQGSSLGMFFLNLKHRAEAAQAAPPPVPEDQQLFVDAWSQVTGRGIDVREDGRVTLNGSLATGAQIESMMAGSGGEMGHGALKEYQLVAAMDWIEKFKETVVRPGPVGAAKIGHEYSEPKADPQGTKANVTHKKGRVTYKLALEAPDVYTTLGDLFSSQKNVGLAVILGVNRPHYVETALWRALDPASDPKAQAGSLLDRVADAEEAAREAEGAKPSRGRRTETVTADEAAAWGVQAEYEELRRLIWPMPRDLDDAGEEALATEFKQQSLLLYKPGDARKFHRERRFATVEAAFD